MAGNGKAQRWILLISLSGLCELQLQVAFNSSPVVIALAMLGSGTHLLTYWLSANTVPDCRDGALRERLKPGGQGGRPRTLISNLSHMRLLLCATPHLQPAATCLLLP